MSLIFRLPLREGPLVPSEVMVYQVRVPPTDVKRTKELRLRGNRVKLPSRSEPPTSMR
jgi:hypothetical protein